MDTNIVDSINQLFTISTDNYIFVYTPPKVGSTTLVTSLRVSLGKNYNIIHIHDETMLSVLTGINDVKINDIIMFLSNQGKNVYVIDVYRTPLERKMSEFFEKISPYHFNNTPDNISKYSINRITDRFNKLFPHIENGDHYFDKYNIYQPIPFDFQNKYTVQIINKIKYIKLRLCDSHLWSNILSKILQRDIVIIHDYKTQDKDIGTLYNTFKHQYKIPINYIQLIKNDKYFNFYYNELERNKYLNNLYSKTTHTFIPYTYNEFNFYINLCLENQYINDIDYQHYIDNGCFCIHCSLKRKEIFFKAKAGEKIFDKIIHTDIIHQLNNDTIKTKYTTLHLHKFKPGQFKINLYHY